jgi:2-desacetyl-2-hydroxyethyl bacteriochlorophyllide A dehydrogenase
MKTIILEQPGQLTLHDTPMPTIRGTDEALVRVLRVGVCGTDLHAYEGTQPFFTYPRVLGHELAVEIVALGDRSPSEGLTIGDICAVNPYLECGTCMACRRGCPNACVRLRVMGVHQDGGMSEYLTVPVRKLHRASDLALEAVALVEMFSVGAHAVSRASINSEDNVLVIGAGPIGLGTMQFAQLRGARVIAMDVNPHRLTFCRDRLGIDYTVNSHENAQEQLQDILGGELPTAVFDATGNVRSMMDAFGYVGHAGRLIFVGINKEDISFSDPHFHSREMTLFASRNATDEDFTQVIDALVTGAIKLDGWITHRTTPEALIADFAAWLKPESAVLKAMLLF